MTGFYFQGYDEEEIKEMETVESSSLLDKIKKGTLYECYIIRPPADCKSDATLLTISVEMV